MQIACHGNAMRYTQAAHISYMQCRTAPSLSLCTPIPVLTDHRPSLSTDPPSWTLPLAHFPLQPTPSHHPPARLALNILAHPLSLHLPLPQHLPRPPLKRLDHQPRHLRRRGLAQRGIERARELHLDAQRHLGPRLALRRRVIHLRPAARGRGFVGKTAQRPARQQGREERVRGIDGLLVRPVGVVGQLAGLQGGARGAAHGFDGRVRRAEDVRVERLAVGLEADGQARGAGVPRRGAGVGRRPGGDARGGAVGEEGRVGRYVCDEGVERGRGVGECARCGEGLGRGGERVGDEGTGGASWGVGEGGEDGGRGERGGEEGGWAQEP